MNTGSLACKGRAQKASKVRKKGQIFGPKMFGLPLFRNAAPSTPSKCGSNGPAYEMRKKRQKKREGKKEGKEEKMRDQITKKNLHAHTFSHHDPCTMTFRECKILAVLVCEE